MSAIAISMNNQVQKTPGKNNFAVPSQALADAIAAEWQANKKFNPSAMLLSALAFTAIDRIEGQQDNIVEALMTYLDTDALCYRSQNLLERQKKEWDPILIWAGAKFGAIWQTTAGLSLEQSPALHEAVADYLSDLDAMQLSALCLLASGFSSLALAIAVLEKRTTPEAAFSLSRLEEEAQAEKWGRDEEAEKRSQRIRDEIVAAGRFLRLLDQA